MNTVQDISKQDCTGCKLCGVVCPVKAISYSVDNEGFWFPQVDEKKCIYCQKCIAMCPTLQESLRMRQSNPEVYAAWSKSEEVRLASTSGGMFYEFGKYIIEQGGVVIGCRYKENWREAEHVVAETLDELMEVVGSKYFQSDTEGVYNRLKERAETGKPVLFAGSPCQVAAARAYLRIDYPNVVLMDYICRDINSPKAFKAYVDELEQKYGSRVVKVRLKDKTRGWESLASHVYFENGEENLQDKNDDYWLRGFIMNDLYTRESCFHCKFRGLPRVSADISVGDFWGIKGKPKKDMFLGISAVLLNNEKGKKLFCAVRDRLSVEQHVIEEVIPGNLALLKDPVKNGKKERFFLLLEKHSFSYAAARCMKQSEWKKSRIWKFAKRCYRFIKFIGKISFWKFIYYNFFSKNVCREGTGYLIPYKHSVINLVDDARIILHDGNFIINEALPKGSRSEAYVLMQAGTSLEIFGSTQLRYGSTIELHKGAVISIGSAFINTDGVILAAKKISIGYDVILGREVYIYDADHHPIYDDGGNWVNAPREVVIGNHVWIGLKSLILKGSVIGEGSVVAAGSIVKGEIPERTIVASAGIARPIRSGRWERG